MSRHSHIITHIEQRLQSITSISILNKFELQKAQAYQYPYCYVELQNEQITYPYEDYYYAKVDGQFSIWVGIETSADGDIRTVFSDLTEKIEYCLRGFEVPYEETSSYELESFSPRITGVYPVSNFNEHEFLYVVTGDYNYNINWK